MIFDRFGKTTVVSQENMSVANLLQHLEKRYLEIANDNIVIDLSSYIALNAAHVLAIEAMSIQHKTLGNSFIVVSDKISYDDVPDTISLVPTLQEAHDIIEMEEIERDLGI